MATYQESVLADTPALYWRLDKTGPPADEDQIDDLSGNALHGELDYVSLGGSLTTYGFASPIETDASSWEFRGFNEGIFASTRVARIGRATDLLIEPLGDFAVEGWLRLPAPVGGASQFGTIMQPMFGRTGSMFVYVDHFDTVAGCLIDSDGDPWLAVSPTSIVIGQSYYVVFQRVANALALYVNAELVAVTTITSGLPNRMDAPGTFLNAQGATQQLPAFYVHPFQVSDCEARYDEVAFYDHSLTGTRVLAHYEAALNATLLRGVANAQTTAILRSTDAADPIEFPFRHNWTETLIERLSFRSAISQSVNGVEEGVGERITPRRELEFVQVLRTNVERRRFRALLWANQHAKWFVPVRQYAERLAEPLSATATLTPISTAFKDYEIDSWIGFRQVSANGEIEHGEVRRVISLNPNSVEHEPLVNPYVANRSIVYPVRRALLSSSISGTGHTDTVEEWTINARLLPEDEALTPNRIITFTPTIKYRDVEVFNGLLWQSNDWSEAREYEVERRVSEVDLDTSLIELDSDTPGASETFTYRMTLSGHEAISSFLGWFYERVGALIPLWVPTMQEDFEIVGVNAPNVQITVRDTNYSDAYALAEARRDIAFVYRDGTMAFRRVIAFEGTVNETLTLDAPIPSLANLRCVSLLKYARLDADQLELAWQTDSVIQVAWRFRELLHTPEGTGRSSLSPSASLSASVSPSSSPSPSASVSPSLSPSLSPSPSASVSPSGSVSPSASVSPSSSQSPSASPSPTPSASESGSASASQSPSSSESPSPSPSASASPSVSPSSSPSPSA